MASGNMSEVQWTGLLLHRPRGGVNLYTLSCKSSPQLSTNTTYYPGCLLTLKQSHLQHNCRPGPPCRKQTTRRYVDEWHGGGPDPKCLVGRVELDTSQPTSRPAQYSPPAPPSTLEALRRDIARNRLRSAHGSKCVPRGCASCDFFLYILRYLPTLDAFGSATFIAMASVILLPCISEVLTDLLDLLSII